MDLYSLGGYLPSDLLAVVFILLVAVDQSYLVELVLLEFYAFPIQQFFINFLEVFLVSIAEENIIVIFVDKAVEGMTVDKDLLEWFLPVILLVGDKVVAVLAVITKEEVAGRGVAEDGVAHLLIVEAVGQVEGYPVVVHVLQQGQYVPVVVDHQLLVVLLYQL